MRSRLQEGIVNQLSAFSYRLSEKLHARSFGTEVLGMTCVRLDLPLQRRVLTPESCEMTLRSES
jgi:hypothetical protein